MQKDEFSDLFQSTHKRILQYVNRRISWDAEDVVDDIFAVAWKRKEDIPANPDERIVWLYAIGRKVIANKIRYKARADRFNKLNNPLVEGSSESSGESNMVTNQVLMEMPQELREPLLLVEWDQLSVKDAAKVLGISESTVNNRLHTARELFARKYSSQE
ncbi:MAG: RNA polymerase sigma factor [Actinobacteria bacterium]|nr:RNA polymerase sigma factor [Actinomycetota bacterium]